MSLPLFFRTVVVVVVVASVACSIAEGDERGPCYPNDTCNGELTCLSGFCVDAGAPKEDPPEEPVVTEPSAEEFTSAFVRFANDCLGLGAAPALARVEPALPPADVSSLTASFANPELVLNEEAYARCLADLRSCDLLGVGDPGSCLDVFDGTRAREAGCGGEEQFDLCLPELVCDAAEDDLACGTCLARPAVGEPCAVDRNGAPVERGCVDGALCVEEPPTTFTCVAALVLGDPCDREQDRCGGGLDCGDGTGASVCGISSPPPRPPRPRVGDGCGADDDNGVFLGCGGFLSGLACVDGRCAAVNAAQPGDPCDVPFRAPDVVNYCVNQFAGLNVCFTADFGTVGVCTVLPTTGPCVGGACAEGFVCDEGGQCVSPPDSRQPCISQTCAEGFVCDTRVGVDGLCRELPGIDQPCIAGLCAEGLKCDGGTTCARVFEVCPA